METIVSRQPSAAGRLTAHLYRHRWLYLLAALLFALCILPLALVPMPKGHDILFHLNRIEALSAEIEAGNIPARIYHTVYGGVGYASGMFYGDWLLYFPAWLVTAGVGVVTAYKLNVMLVTVMTLLIAFFCAKAAFGDDRCAFTAAVTYGFSGYFAIDTYTRAAVGEMTAFAFVPLVFLGLWSILCGDKKKWLCLPVGLTFLLVSHVLSAFAAVLLCAVFFLCYLGRVIKEPRRLLYIGCAVLVFAVLSASFLFPMLEQMASGTFLSTDGTSATYYGTLTQRSLPWWASVFDFNTRLDYKSAAFGFWIPNGLGMSFFVMLAAFVRYITRIDDKKNLFVFLYFSVFLLLMTTELFPWSYFQSLCGTMQFPWRLLLFATFFMALFAGQFIRQAPTKNASAVFCTLFVCCSLFSYVSTASVSILNYANYAANGTEITYNYKDNIGAGEYLPSSDLNPPSYRSFLYNRRDRVTTNNASLGTLKAERGHGSVSVAFSGNNEVDTYIDVPLLMYKGYAARVTLEKDGSEVELPVGYGENNLVRVHLQGVAAGTVTVWYEGTAVQKVSFVVTAVGFGLLLAGGCAYAVLRRRRSGGTPAGGQASQPAISSETVTKE